MTRVNAAACRFGNRVLNPLSQAAFAADGTGPGRLTAVVVRASDAELAVHYSAEKAGRYSLVVRCSSSGEARLHCCVYSSNSPSCWIL